MKGINWLLTSALAISMTGCGGSGGGGSDSNVSGPSPDNGRQICERSAGEVQWDKLKTENLSKLSEYQLFESQCNPTVNPNARGLAYDLSVPLFTDYASKYRFVFIPPNAKATYQKSEVFDFPTGSVLTKTFSLPSNTDSRGFDSENLIETRLLIKRENGWVSLPYIWNDAKTDATLSLLGKSVPTTLQHHSDTLSFDYGVPTPQQCVTCHQYNPGGNKDYVKDNSGNTLNADGEIVKLDNDQKWYLADGNGDFILDNGNRITSSPEEAEKAFFSPIGPKARYLNTNYDYGSGEENQLSKWVNEGLLNAFSDNDIDTTPIFNDDVSVDSLTPAQLDENAKAWLDINCSHCHRLEGTASNTTFKPDYWSDTHQYDGTCREAVSGADGSISTILIPGDAENSLVYHRLNTIESGDLMPPLGRAVIHDEGTLLIKRWLESQSGGCDH